MKISWNGNKIANETCLAKVSVSVRVRERKMRVTAQGKSVHKIQENATKHLNWNVKNQT